MAGLVYLVSPGLEAPPILGAALMVVAGITWGFYSLLGRGSQQPINGICNDFRWRWLGCDK